MQDKYEQAHIPILSVSASNYEGMVALVDTQNQVYLGKPEHYHPCSRPHVPYYDNTDNSLQFVSSNIKMFHFLYGKGFPIPQRQMRREHDFTKADYIEFAHLRDDVLSRFTAIREITFAGKPFVPPKSYSRGRRDMRRPIR